MLCRDICDVFSRERLVGHEYNLDEILSPKACPRLASSLDMHSLPLMPPELESRPWKQDPDYFKKVYISALALAKMTIHAKSGGNLEVMGMMTGKIMPHAFVVMDVYQLPVEGTETRVNAQAEGYEYMVQFLEATREVGGRDENIVGWYHSHPGYGCWLLGIDVNTQALQQGFQDPYLAVVIDPLKTVKQNKVEIGAFRTYPQGHKPKNDKQLVLQKELPVTKRNDFGIHADRYYSLDIEIVALAVDESIVSMVRESDDNNLTHLMSTLATFTEGTVVELRDTHLNQVARLADDLGAAHMAPSRKSVPKKLQSTFADLVTKRMVQVDPIKRWSNSLGESDDDKRDDAMAGEDAEDESDLEQESGNQLSDGDEGLVDLNLVIDEDDEMSTQIRRQDMRPEWRSRIRKGPLKTHQFTQDQSKMVWPSIKLATLAVAQREAKELMTLDIQEKLFL